MSQKLHCLAAVRQHFRRGSLAPSLPGTVRRPLNLWGVKLSFQQEKTSRVGTPSALVNEPQESGWNSTVRCSQKWFARTWRLRTNSCGSLGTVQKRGVGTAMSCGMRASPAAATPMGSVRPSMETATKGTNGAAGGSATGTKLLTFQKRPRRDTTEVRHVGRLRECQLLVAKT